MGWRQASKRRARPVEFAVTEQPVLWLYPETLTVCSSTALLPNARSISFDLMLRRPAIVLLSLFVVFAVHGNLCGQAQAATAADCCKTSCPKSQHRDPLKCCNIHLAPSTPEVVSAHQVTPDPTQIAALSFAEHSFAKLELRAVAFETTHPPPSLALSPERLCSLQI
jgi:hypothetical protein